MPSFKSWLKASRLRTLPLALSSILMGSFLAIREDNYQWIVIILAIVTTTLLQVLSNFSNDYGDSMRGTDNENRLGPVRTVQGGEISPKQMRMGMLFIVILTLFSGIWLIYESFADRWFEAFIFLAFGILAILASIKYTVGKKSYGYAGFGDAFVFVFFGLLAVAGTYYLNTLSFSWYILLPAATLGFFSTAVLNLNNMRDMENDRHSGKKTIVVRIGYKSARNYQLWLIFTGFLATFIYVMITFTSYWEFLFVTTFPLFAINLNDIFKVTDQRRLDPYLKKTALATLIFVIVFGIGLLI
ncbi:MAG: 1,4-dihydroxy-2-naphthoate polyprenyltransferase [Bacteroidetes bacterium]|nr:1,4-dihydroxy-2-naphthoate polyprenyltransferase [Bacteroidota bacterium]